MRRVGVYYGDVYAGQLVELARGDYEFIYDDAFLADGNYPPVSVNLPKSRKEYHADHIFPVFTNMLPEGANRSALCRARKVDEDDFFGMLEMICGMDAIGNSGYSPHAVKALFDGVTVSPFIGIDFGGEGDRHQMMENMNNMSISGAQEKFSAVIDNGNIRLCREGEQATYILEAFAFPLELVHTETDPCQ